MKTIYKYPLEPTTSNIYHLPKGSEIISVQEQRGGVNFYAVVDTEISEIEEFEVLFYGTGHNVTDRIGEYKFIGTVSMYGGDLVFHIFARPKREMD